MAKKKSPRGGAEHRTIPTSSACGPRYWSSPSRRWKSSYMPYAMRRDRLPAIPEIDGFKPPTGLLYTMHKMGLLTGARTKSANIVGQTMKLNPTATPPYTIPWSASPGAMGALLHPWWTQGQLRQGLLPGHGLGRQPVYRGQAG